MTNLYPQLGQERALSEDSDPQCGQSIFLVRWNSAKESIVAWAECQFISGWELRYKPSPPHGAKASAMIGQVLT